MRRQLGIRWKVLTVLALPVAVLAVAAGTQTLGALRQAQLARTIGAFAEAQDPVATAITALQRERLVSTSADQLADLRAVRLEADRDLVALTSALRASRVADVSPEAADLVQDLQNAHARVREVRAQVDGGAPVDEARAGYAAIIEADVELAGAVGELLTDRALARRFTSATMLNRAMEAAATAHLVGLDSVRAGEASAARQAQLSVALADHSRATAAFRVGGSVVDARLQQQAAAATAAFVDLAERLQSSAGDRITVSPEVWTSVGSEQVDALRRLSHAVAAEAASEADSSAESATLTVALVAGSAVTLVGLMVLLALMQSRRITAPLRRLAEVTTRTRDELPAAVEAISMRGAETVELPSVDRTGTDEVGAVATAFADVQGTVIEIAHAQARLRAALADAFVNVARRNQVLLARQLSFIDTLERGEEDPDALQNLFRLDHLATRMRRNAESLLVLAGIESGRRARSSMPVSDVIRAAIGEVEHYERVRLSVTLNPLVVAHLSLPAAHLIAELIENATNFSDPAATVVVTTTGAARGVQVRVIDKGLGLSAEDLAEANERLADAESSVLVPVQGSATQRLGLHVVARLSARLGARVWLEHGQGSGTVAVVELPAVVFVEGSTPSSTGEITQIDVTAIEQPGEPEPLPEQPEPLPEPLQEPLPGPVQESLPEPLPARPAPPPQPRPEQPPAVADPEVQPGGEQAPRPLPRRRRPPVATPPVPQPAEYGMHLPDGVLPSGLRIPPPPLEAAPAVPRDLAPLAPLPPPDDAVPTPPPTAGPDPATPPLTPVGYGLQLPSDLSGHWAFPPPPEELLDPAPSGAPTGVPTPPAGPTGGVPPVPALMMPATMDVLPHRPPAGFSLSRLGRWARSPRPVAVTEQAIAPLLPGMPVQGRGAEHRPDQLPDQLQDQVADRVAGQVDRSDQAAQHWPQQSPDPAADRRARTAAQAELASTALSELSMLASYRPEVEPGSPASLARRVPAAPAHDAPEPSITPAPPADPTPIAGPMPIAAPATTTVQVPTAVPEPPFAAQSAPAAGPSRPGPSLQRPARSADTVRSLMSGFSRGVRSARAGQRWTAPPAATPDADTPTGPAPNPTALDSDPAHPVPTPQEQM